MKKDLPGLFANKINKSLSNNEKVSVTKNEEQEDRSIKEDKKTEKDINEKIREMFSSPRYVYKIDAEITLKDKKVTKKIIGKNNNNLITIDNELIPIQDIIGLDSNARMNTPGVADGNWQFRFNENDLTENMAETLKYFCKLFNR